MNNSYDYKKIIEVKYPFKIKKGKIYVGVVMTDDAHFRFIQKTLTTRDRVSRADDNTILHSVYNHEDYVIWLIPISNVHLPDDAQWIELSTLNDTVNYYDELEDAILLYKLLFECFDRLNNHSTVSQHELEKHFEVFKALQYESNKRSYIEEVKYYAEGGKPRMRDAYVTGMDTKLLEQELLTLEHFEPYDSSEVSWVGYSPEDDSPTKVMSRFYYSYSMNFGAFGGEVVNRWNRRRR